MPAKNDLALEQWLTIKAFALIPASYVASFAAGLPLILALQHLKKLSFGWITLFAVPLGAVANAVYFVMLLALGATAKGSAFFETLRFSSVGGALGFIVAALFCLLVGISLPFSANRA